MARTSAAISYVFVIFAFFGTACGGHGKHIRGFVKTQDTQFVLNGSPFLFNGFNSYWMINVATDPAERYKVSDVLRDAAASGMSVCRTWAFADGGDRALQISPGVYDERVFQGLDFVISEARRYGVRLILSLVNNYKEYGGRSQYVQWARNAGVNINDEDDFYTDPVVKKYYKNHVQKVLTRFNTFTKTVYKDDPAIMAWELINEPRCQADISGNSTVHGWVEEMAKYTKSLDTNHMLEIGMEGFYGDSMPKKKQNNPGFQVGTDFIKSNLIEEIDFATIHAYPDLWLPGQNDGAHLAFMQRWIASHWFDSRRILKKPLAVAEFGKSSKDQGYSVEARDSYLSDVYRNIYNFAKSGGGVGGGLVWQLMAPGMDSYFDGYQIVLPRNPSTAAVVHRHSSKMSDLRRLLGAAHVHEVGRLQVSHVHGRHHVPRTRKPYHLSATPRGGKYAYVTHKPNAGKQVHVLNGRYGGRKTFLP